MASAQPTTQPTAPARTRGPWFGLAAVLFGAFISTLTGRLSTFGLADIRGAVHAGFDDGAWITTAQTAGQMLVTPLTIWAGGVYGPRRVLMWGASLFALASFYIPFCTTLAPLLALQLLSGIGSGTFIPLTLPVVLRTLTPRYWAYGIVTYSLSLELSLNISASLEAWYIDHLSWHFIFWQNIPLALGMLVCLYLGLPRAPLPRDLKRPDLFGVISAAIGLALIYAAFDQGNRLDWLSSGTIIGLMAGGAILLLASFLHLALVPSEWFAPKGAFRWPLPMLLLMVLVLRLTILSTAFLIPQFLIFDRGFRSLEVGQAMVWIAIPQLVTAPVAAVFLRRMDSRWIACIGLVCIGTACWIVATMMTPEWGPQQFLPTQLLQALGQSLALSGVIYTSVQQLEPKTALTFGAMIQTARLMGGEMGLAATTTFVRLREQHASNLLGQHVMAGDLSVTQRLNDYAHVVASQSGGLVGQRSIALLAGAVRQAAQLQSYIDGFLAIGFMAFLMLAVLLCMARPPVGPASYRPFHLTFWRRST